jgi:hypothetical protein
MNNFTFGNDRFGYYETICGGSGAGEGINKIIYYHLYTYYLIILLYNVIK